MSAIFFGGAPGKILHAWKAGRIGLAVSPEIIKEYIATAEVLSVRYENDSLESILTLVVKHSELWQSPPLLVQVCSDPNDDKFLACALASGADCVVSGDKALQRVSGFRNVQVMAPRAFVDTML